MLPPNVSFPLMSNGYLVGSLSLAAGDVRVRIDGGSWVNRSPVPSVVSGFVDIALTNGERAAKKVEFALHDQDGSDFDDAAALLIDDSEEMADTILTRDFSEVEESAPEHCLATVGLAVLEWEISLDGQTLTIYRTDGSTVHYTKDLTNREGTGEVITGVA